MDYHIGEKICKFHKSAKLFGGMTWRIRISASTSDFHSGKRGSTPLCATIGNTQQVIMKKLVTRFGF